MIDMLKRFERAATWSLPAPRRAETGIVVWPTLFEWAPSSEMRAAMEARHRLGIERYGMPLMTGDGRPAGVDAFQELLDAAAYYQKDWLAIDGDGPSQPARRLLVMADRLMRGGL